jgi:hypothetical protein
MAFTEAEKREMKKRHEAWKKARSSGKMKEYKAKQQAKQDKADAKTKKDLKAKNKLWKTDRKEYNKQKRKHITKQETKRFDAAASRTEAFNKKNKRGKYSKGHEKKQEKLYGKNLTGLRKGLSKINPFKKESVKKENLKIKTDRENKKKRKQRTISSRVEAEMNR